MTGKQENPERTAAINYAQSWWWRPCPDGWIYLVGGKGHPDKRKSVESYRQEANNSRSREGKELISESNGWITTFQRYVDSEGIGERAVFRSKKNGEEVVFQDWAGLGDCDHFVTECLRVGQLADLTNTRAPYHTEHLIKALDSKKNKNKTKMLAERVNQGQGQLIVDSGILQRGDIVGYWDVKDSRYGHSGMYVGKPGGGDQGGITCHSKCRFKNELGLEYFTSAQGVPALSDDWHLDQGDQGSDYKWNFTFIHFAEEGESPAACAPLFGWWVIGDKKKYFFYVSSDGQAYLTSHPPRDQQTTRVLAAFDSAFWFQADGRQTKFAWRQGGVWVVTPVEGGISIVMNDGPLDGGVALRGIRPAAGGSRSSNRSTRQRRPGPIRSEH